MQLHRLKKKKKITIYRLCENQRPIKRDKEAKRGKERSIRSAEERGKKRERQQDRSGSGTNQVKTCNRV